MKFINKFKSLNFDTRVSSTIEYIIIHYTALKNNETAISFLCNPKKKVSCHFLISQNGDIYNLVNEKKRAWHAGLCYWKGKTDINSSSLGIELDYSLNKENNNFTNKMMKSLVSLLKYLTKKYNIDIKNVLGHSDIAPYRKKDPGKNFPWDYLVKNKLAFFPNNNYQKIDLIRLDNWFKNNGFNSKKNIIIYILNNIGYDTSKTIKNYNNYKKLVQAYQIHYLQFNVNGRVDKITYNFLSIHFLNLVLNKNKKIIIDI
ncbi:MAG: hypothetical protein CBD97_03640 [Pelagibacteraceae bacterium TMED237]|mgnify:CR=1 FL=1|nr:MAG: hypothetical protein CBD97_03640 [Pelagibacteraceae bacterium TMED237]|tara:strand:- start:167 stop:940 length:774 start_codon:yes stop_codon:yes gene_type:complete